MSVQYIKILNLMIIFDDLLKSLFCHFQFLKFVILIFIFKTRDLICDLEFFAPSKIKSLDKGLSTELDRFLRKLILYGKAEQKSFFVCHIMLLY
jgi:hypothetical protein